MLITPVEYKKFRVVTDLVPPVTQENYFKHDFYIIAKNGSSLTIRKEQMWWVWAKNLLSGNEKEAQEALEDIVDTKEEEIKLLKSML